MNRYLATSLVATTTGAMLVFVADGCAIDPLAGIPYVQEKAEETRKLNDSRPSSSSSTSGGAGGGGNCSCADDSNECTDDVVGACPNGDMKACNTAVAGRKCGAAKSGTCDALGMCIPCNECSDANCMQRCVGQPCTAGTECANGQCVDGFCCDSDCTGPCKACNRVPGICSPLPAGLGGECPAGQLCGNGTGCVPQTAAPLGNLCTLDADCETGKCVAQVCVSPDDQLCVEHLECASRLCDGATHKCVACGGSVKCPDGTGCVNGKCKVFAGQPASNTNECVAPAKVSDNLTCTFIENAVCTNDSECIYHDCNGAPNGTCAAGCTVDAECPMGTTCDKLKGSCRLAPGSYCVISDQCQGKPPAVVGTCGGFPRRCL